MTRTTASGAVPKGAAKDAAEAVPTTTDTIDADVLKSGAAAFDHDGDGKPGGSRKGRRARKA
jgi:hypothetical protein